MPFALQPKARPRPPAAAAGRSSPLVSSFPGASSASCGPCSSRTSPRRSFSTTTTRSASALRSYRVSTPTRSSSISTTAEVVAAYERDKAEARSAAGTAIEAQGKASTADPGVVRYTAPSVIFERDGQRLVAGGWQPELAYDLCIANLDPTLGRTPPPEDAGALLEWFPDGLTTAEMAALLAPGPDYVPDYAAAEQQMVKLVATGAATTRRLGNDPLWQRLHNPGRAEAAVPGNRNAVPV